MTTALVSTQWVADNLSSPRVRIAEVSVETSLYATEHLPGAVNFNWTTQLQDQVRRDIISKEDLPATIVHALQYDMKTMQRITRAIDHG